MSIDDAAIDRRDPRVSGAVQAMAIALLLAAITAGASSVVRVETLLVRVDQLERDRPAMLEVGQKLGVLTQQMTSVGLQLEEIRKDQRAERRPSPK